MLTGSLWWVLGGVERCHGKEMADTLGSVTHSFGPVVHSIDGHKAECQVPRTQHGPGRNSGFLAGSTGIKDMVYASQYLMMAVTILGKVTPCRGPTRERSMGDT